MIQKIIKDILLKTLKHGIIPNNNMKDTFKNLQDAIHNLENFMNSNK